MSSRSLKANEFFEWLSTGTAAASLALFIYIISSAEINLSAAVLFVISMPFSAAGTAIAKEISIHENTTKKASLMHAISLTAGGLSFLGGLGVLSLSVSAWLLITLFLSFCVALIIYSHAYNSLAVQSPKVH
ncbi:hypothetical protein ACNFH5_27560 [Pseudomonas sp. NY15435]|uniref:hypothetical protein n=1 Tax=Pseudomonas sp. NY15435 TaxID=3400358 RepID=UPI003A86BCE8